MQIVSTYNFWTKKRIAFFFFLRKIVFFWVLYCLVKQKQAIETTDIFIID